MTKMTKLAIVLFAFLPFAAPVFAQTQGEITEENYQRLDSILWAQLDLDAAPIFEEFERHPERGDSLKRVYDEIYGAAQRKNVELAIEYASVPSGFRRLFMVRLKIPKERLRSVLATLPEEMRASPTGRSIRMHLDNDQIEEGSRYYDFEATTDADEAFRLSSLAGKKILFLYGGMDCMGQDGRDYLNSLYERTSRDDFEIVVYCINSDLEALKKVREVYPCKFILVSDFLQDNTPVKIIYGAQATPTCFFIDSKGIVRMKMEGLDTVMVDELVAE